MKPTKTELNRSAAEKAGFIIRPWGKHPFFVELVRARDGKSFGVVHRFLIEAWTGGAPLADWRGNKLPSVEQAKVAA